jgi:hypothetical protein
MRTHIINLLFEQVANMKILCVAGTLNPKPVAHQLRKLLFTRTLCSCMEPGARSVELDLGVSRHKENITFLRLCTASHETCLDFSCLVKTMNMDRPRTRDMVTDFPRGSK